MAAKPIVDGIERKHASQLSVIRLNVQDPAGQALLSRFKFQFTPTFIYFDASGDELKRWVGGINSFEVDELLAGSSPD